MKKVEKEIVLYNINNIRKKIEKMLEQFAEEHKIYIYNEIGLAEELGEYITQNFKNINHLQLYNIVKHRDSRKWGELPQAQWHRFLEQVVDIVKGYIINYTLTYWEEEVDYLDNWEDWKKGGKYEIVTNILKWNPKYIKLGLFTITIKNRIHQGGLFVFQFPECQCYIATNFWVQDKELLPITIPFKHICDLIIQYHDDLDPNEWEHHFLDEICDPEYIEEEEEIRPFWWFPWNSDTCVIVPKGTDDDDLRNKIIPAIENLPLHLDCNQRCNKPLLMKVPVLQHEIVQCYECNLGICKNCGTLTYNAITNSDGALCEYCSVV